MFHKRLSTRKARPSGAKARIFPGPKRHAEAVPYPKPIYETLSRDLDPDIPVPEEVFPRRLPSADSYFAIGSVRLHELSACMGLTLYLLDVQPKPSQH